MAWDAVHGDGFGGAGGETDPSEEGGKGVHGMLEPWVFPRGNGAIICIEQGKAVRNGTTKPMGGFIGSVSSAEVEPVAYNTVNYDVE